MPPIPPTYTVTERIVLGHDSLPHPVSEPGGSLPPRKRKSVEPYQQMFRIVDDLRTVLEQRNTVLRALRTAQRDALRPLILLTARREAGGIQHCLHVGAISALLAKTLGKPADWCNMLFDAAAVHDLGNISIPDSILFKTSRLTRQEWRVVRDHPIAGAALLSSPHNPIELLAAEVALNHHEKWDGSGYPAGRQGSNIPLAGRIVAVADFVDSLGFASSYRAALPDEDIFHLLSLTSGAQFDPRVVRAMIELRPRLARIRERSAEWGPRFAISPEHPLWWNEI